MELGIDLNPKQVDWCNSSHKKINVLATGNQWGKTTSEAVKHIHHALTKPNLAGRVGTPEMWLNAEYKTLNFGLTYEVAKPVKEAIIQIVNNEFLIHDRETGRSYFNEGKLKGWALVDETDEPFPELTWHNNSKTLFRSYDKMGTSFKAKVIAFISGDEVGDIPNLRTFVNGTLLPRLVAMDGRLDLIGTPQADKSEDYLWFIEEAQNDTEGLYYFQGGSMYDNVHLPEQAIRETEAIADPELRRQIIYGEHVSTGEKYFSFDEIHNAVDDGLILLDDAGAGKYIAGADFAAGEDYTVFLVVDYSREPYDLVYHLRFKGKKVSVPMQYELFKDIVRRFKARSIIDTSSLGGKNALAFLREINPIEFNFTPKSKSEMLGTLKIAFQGGQSDRLKRDLSTEGGMKIDHNPFWGLIRIPNKAELVKELQNYKLPDDAIIQDQVMTLGMIIHWIELRRPKKKRSVLNIDLLTI